MFMKQKAAIDQIRTLIYEHDSVCWKPKDVLVFLLKMASLYTSSTAYLSHSYKTHRNKIQEEQ